MAQCDLYARERAGRQRQGPYCGAVSYGSNPCCDAQSCYPSCQQQNRVCYKLVWDTVTEKRWHTCYKPLQETITKQVCRTVWKEECKTLQRQVQGRSART